MVILMAYITPTIKTLTRYKIILLYILGAIIGALATSLCSSYFYLGDSLIGASASVFAFVTYCMLTSPNTILSFGILKIKTIHFSILLITMSLLSMIDDVNLGGEIAHIGGILVGILYYLKMKLFG